MNPRISFLAKSRAPGMGAPPLPVAHFTGDFASLEDARKIAFADADKPEIKANSIVIQSVDETITEYWVRNDAEWKIGDPAAVTGEAEEDWGW
jgi:hypothetical protein